MTSTTSVRADTRRDAVAAAALTVVRRALVEGADVTRDCLISEAAVNLQASHDDAVREVDATAQQLGVSSLT